MKMLIGLESACTVLITTTFLGPFVLLMFVLSDGHQLQEEDAKHAPIKWAGIIMSAVLACALPTYKILVGVLRPLLEGRWKIIDTGNDYKPALDTTVMSY
jgi:hypothetical protein